MSPSLVMLLREFHFFTAAELEATGERGWNKPFGTPEEPMFFVVQQGSITFLKTGPYVINLLQANQPYAGSIEDNAKQLPRPEQKAA